MRPRLTICALMVLGCHRGSLPNADFDAGVPDMAPVPIDPRPLSPPRWSDCGPFTASSPFDPGVYGASPVCTGDLWCWQGTVPQGNTLRAVFELAPSDVWAAGDLGTILHYDGTRWSATPSPVGVSLKGLWASSPTDVWAVGDNGFILHFDGGGWTVVATSPAGLGLNAIWGTSSTDIWAGGNNLLHWDGQTWSPATNLPYPFLTSISGIWGSAPNNVYAVGAPALGGGFSDMGAGGASVMRWDGSSWTAVTTPIGPLTSIWGSGPSDVWVDGKTVWHFDGTNWWQMATATGPMWGPAVGDVWILGSEPFFGAQTQISSGVVATTNSGIKWGYNAIAGAGTDAWAVGNGGEMAHFDGQAWSSQTRRLFDAPSEYSPVLLQVHGTSASDLWVVGEGAIAHWDGSAWSRFPVCTYEDWRGVFTPAPNDVWIVGGQKLLHGDGTRWRIADDPNADDPSPLHKFYGVWGSGPTDLWAVDSALLHFDGTDWSVFDAVSTLTTVTGTGPNHVLVAGSSRIGHSDGATYEETALSDPIVSINALWAPSADDVWAVGTNGWAHWDGVAWQLTKESLLDVRGIWGSSDTDIWAVGGRQLRHWDGASWISQSPPSVASSTIFGTSSTDLWMPGIAAILRYRVH